MNADTENIEETTDNTDKWDGKWTNEYRNTYSGWHRKNVFNMIQKYIKNGEKGGSHVIGNSMEWRRKAACRKTKKKETETKDLKSYECKRINTEW